MLKKCNDCKEEISLNVDKCPKCGSKKPFKNINLNLEESKQLSYKEQREFIKLGGKTSNGIGAKIISAIFAVILMLIIINLFSSKSDKITLQEVQQIEVKLSTIPELDISQNYNAYKKLSGYYKNNTEYQSKFEKYKKFLDFESECAYQANRLSKESAKNKNTYEPKVMAGLTYTKFISKNVIYSQVNFSAKNDFNTEIEHIGKFQCEIKNDTVNIKLLSMTRR